MMSFHNALFKIMATCPFSYRLLPMSHFLTNCSLCLSPLSHKDHPPPPMLPSLSQTAPHVLLSHTTPYAPLFSHRIFPSLIVCYPCPLSLRNGSPCTPSLTDIFACPPSYTAPHAPHSLTQAAPHVPLRDCSLCPLFKQTAPHFSCSLTDSSICHTHRERFLYPHSHTDCSPCYSPTDFCSWPPLSDCYPCPTLPHRLPPYDSPLFLTVSS